MFSFHCSNEIERDINGGHTKTNGKNMKCIGERQRKSKEIKENEQKMLVRKNKNNDGSKVRS